MDRAVEERIENGLQRLSLAVALPGMAALVFLIAWNRGIALLYGLVTLLAGVLIVAWLAPRFNLRGVTARRTHPASTHEGDTVQLSIAVRANGFRPRFMIEVHDRLPFAENAPGSPMAYFDRVKGHAEVTLAVRCELRGEHELGPLSLETAYPLGIRRARRDLSGSGGKILVYPRPFPIASLPLVGASQSPFLGMRAASMTGDSEHFFGVREYRHGDNPRNIHWAATARRGELIVKEFEYARSTELCIVLNLERRAQHGEGKHAMLEYAVKIAASVARHALDNGHAVGLLGMAASLVEVPVGRGPDHYRLILETLARVRADGTTPYHQAVNRATARLARGGVLFLFEHGASQDVAAEKQSMFQHHVRPIRVHFDAVSFSATTSAPTRPARPSGATYLIRRGDDLAEIFAR